MLKERVLAEFSLLMPKMSRLERQGLIVEIAHARAGADYQAGECNGGRASKGIAAEMRLDDGRFGPFLDDDERPRKRIFRPRVLHEGQPDRLLEADALGHIEESAAQEPSKI